MPEPDQDATYAPNIVEEVALFNHKYARFSLSTRRAVVRAATWMARHKAMDADSRAAGAGSEVVGRVVAVRSDVQITS